MSLNSLFNDFMLLSVLLIIGVIIRSFVKPFQRWFLPAAFIGGIVGLFLGQQFLGIIEIPSSFGGFNGTLMRIIMACSVLGVNIDLSKLRDHLDYTFCNAFLFGLQIALGLLLAEGLTAIWTDMPFGWGILGVLAYFGSHGTAAAGGEILIDMLPQITEGAVGVGLLLATGGLIISMTVGMYIVNYGVKRGWGTFVKEPEKQPDYFYRGILPQEARQPIAEYTTTPNAVNPIMLHLGVVAVSYAIGWAIFYFLIKMFPILAQLHPMLFGLVGGIILWPLMRKFNLAGYCDRRIFNLIAGVCLEIIIVTAMASIQVDLVTRFFIPLLIHIIVCCGITVFFCIWFFRKVRNPQWFEKCCMAIGTCTGSSTNGLALVRAIDPQAQSIAPEAHGVYNGLFWWNNLFNPILPTMVVLYSLWTTVGLGIAFMVGAGLLAYLVFRKQVRAREASEGKG
ncbi:MAG: hypothetical protein LIP23_08620 [Planctomycetes bacterium]|nr:hypothetical protein [Planctomycetota bacterium]